MKKGIFFVVTVMLCFLLVSCNQAPAADDLWVNAIYTEDLELGEGAKAIQTEVKTPDKAVTFTINTDETTLGAALMQHGLIAGEQGAYGLYVKTVNGITADYDIDKSYWALEKNGESVQTGVDGTAISDGEHYELIYTK